MTHFSIGRAIGLMRKTAPFILFRAVVYFGIAAAYVIATGVGAGMGWVVGAFGSDDFQAGTTFWGGAAGFGIVAGILYFLREYTLYLVKAGHIAVMVEALDGRRLPAGRSQIDYAQSVVRKRFGEASILFGIDQVIKGVLRAVIRLVGSITAILPIPGLNRIAGLIHGFLKIAVGMLDEVILAHSFRNPEENPYASAKIALVLYAQNARPMMINAAWLTLVTWALSIVVFFVMLAPAAFVVWILPGTMSAGGFVFAVLFAWAAKVAVIEPFVIACMLQAYFSVTEGQSPKPDWIGKLDSASAEFHRLSESATKWVWVRPEDAAPAEPDPAPPKQP